MSWLVLIGEEYCVQINVLGQHKIKNSDENEYWVKKYGMPEAYG